jgi:hypothetical protein
MNTTIFCCLPLKLAQDEHWIQSDTALIQSRCSRDSKLSEIVFFSLFGSTNLTSWIRQILYSCLINSSNHKKLAAFCIQLGYLVRRRSCGSRRWCTGNHHRVHAPSLSKWPCRSSWALLNKQQGNDEEKTYQSWRIVSPCTRFLETKKELKRSLMHTMKRIVSIIRDEMIGFPI